MPAYAHFYGQTKEILNGEVVEDTAVNYDGNTLHILANNRLTHYDIKADKLKTLLATPSSRMNLLDRLKQDYSHKREKSHKREQGHKREKSHKREQGHKHTRHKREKSHKHTSDKP